MIDKIIRYSIENRGVVLILTAFLIAGGILAVNTIKLDAIPDLSDVQVIIQIDYPGQAPDVIEDQVTYPLTTAMLQVPQAKTVRGYSFFGFAFVYLIFEDGTDIYWARSRVIEYLNTIDLPAAAKVKLGPDATGLGWVYEYVIMDSTGTYDLAEMRSVQDFYLKYELMTVPGVAEVASIGGFVKQYQVEVDPLALQAYSIPLQKVKQRILKSNKDVGGKLVEMAETEYMVRGKGYITKVEDIENIPLGVNTEGVPILLSDVAKVGVGPEIRRGILEWNGESEVVGGIIVMRFGENALEVIDLVKNKLDELKAGLPEGMYIETGYDRSDLILRAVDTLKHKLTEEMIVVALITIIFLLHIRSSLVAFITLPVGVLSSILIMQQLGIAANIMSLGGIAIAIGVMVDASVVMVENAHKHLERFGSSKPRTELVYDACKEVGPALFFSLLIITISFFPIFALTEQSGRLFKPLAYTKTFAMAASAILAITLIPALIYYFIRGKILSERKHPISRFLHWIYRPILRLVLKIPLIALSITLLILMGSYYPLTQLGSEFMPPLNEGDLLYMPTTPPGISITKAKELLQQTDRMIKTFPEVHHVLGKIGRAETATDPAPLSMIETTIILEQDKNKWRKGVDIDSLVSELDAAIQIPGLTNAWTMPIKTRIDMLSTGIKTPVGIKLMGADLEVLNELGQEIEAVMRTLPGTSSAYSERAVGGNFIDYEINREEAARYGLTIDDIQNVIMSAVGGMNITKTVEGLERYPVNLRYPRELRDDLDALKNILISTPTGAQIPISQVADLKVKKGAPVIKTENARRTVWVYVDIRGIDVGTFIGQAKEALQNHVEIPAGYSIVWSGQFEYMEAARKNLQILVPVVLVIIFLLLYFHFHNFTESLIVMGGLPFALVGGIWLLYILDYNTSLAVWVGFIALAGLAAETGVVMLVYLDEAVARYKRGGILTSRKALNSAIMEGAVDRVRPKMMTVATTIIALLPIMWGTGTGSEVMRRIAAPMVGGLITSTILTLLIIPAIYEMAKRHLLPKTEK
ncbi:MAG: efflux RND transporter permease subunit [candidate division Zixibacteria bacterium]|nr:efflux RND transporter permease subunit [Candidatus Tariuqbacter arcticus]